MAEPKGYQGLKPTRHHKRDFPKIYADVKAEVLTKKPELKTKYKDLNRAIYKETGFPFWNEKGEAVHKGGGSNYKFYYMNQGKPRLVDTRKLSSIKSGKLRDQWLKASNEHLSPEQIARTNLLKRSINRFGKEADHKYEAQETGPMIEQLVREKELGKLSKKEFNAELMKLRKRGIGDDPKNFQSLTSKENTLKAKEVKAKNRALEKLEKANLSDRYKGFDFKTLFGKGKNKPTSKNVSSLKMKRNPQDRLSIQQGNNWSDPLLRTPLIKTLDKSTSIKL